MTSARTSSISSASSRARFPPHRSQPVLPRAATKAWPTSLSNTLSYAIESSACSNHSAPRTKATSRPTIERTLRRHSGNRTRAAEELGISRATLINKIRAYSLQDDGLDTVEANLALGFRDDERDYAVAAHMLMSLKIQSVQLMTNNPKKIVGLEGYGLQVVGRVPVETEPRPENLRYLVTKCQKLGHLLNLKGRDSREPS